MTKPLSSNNPLLLSISALLVVSGSLIGAEQIASQAGADTKPKPAPASQGLVNDWLQEQSSLFKDWNFGGQFRARFEHAEYLDASGAPQVDTAHGPVDFRATGGDRSNDHLLLREFVHVGYTPMSWLNFYVEGRDSSSTADDRNPNPDSDSMDLHQAYIRLGSPKVFPVSLKLGRQELVYGDERLVGASDWTNVKRTFDAAKLRYENDFLWVDAFVCRPVVVWDNHFNEDNDYEYLSGVYASSVKVLPFEETQVYFLSRNTELQSPSFYGASPLPQGSSPRDIYTVGGRLKSLPGKLGGWDYTVEGAYQFGRFKETTKKAPATIANENLDQNAFAVAAGGGYTFKDAFGTPRVGAEYVYASGDSGATNGTHGTFDNLFPTNHKFYGIMDLFSWQNIQIARVSASLKPLKALMLVADYRLAWLADTRDSFYTNKGGRRGGLTATSGSGYGINPDNSNFVGSEIDLVATYAINSYALIQAGIGHFFVGDYIQESLSAVGGAKDGNFIYGQLTFNF